MFPDIEFVVDHLRQIKQQAGNRYTPELNVELPISEIFDGLSRTEKFYHQIRKNYGDLTREFKHISNTYKNEESGAIYEMIYNNISILFSLLDNIKIYNTDIIPWDNINTITNKLEDNIWELVDHLRDDKENLKKDNNGKNRENTDPYFKRLEHDIHYLYKTRSIIQDFNELACSVKAKVSNKPYLFIHGAAGTGKTHLLCDLVEQRNRHSLNALIVFGEYFNNEEYFWKQLLCQLKIDDLNISDFLSTINQIGKKEKSRFVLIIDALNENYAHAPKFWKKNINSIVTKLSKYPNIALIISLRSGFEYEVFNSKQLDLFID
ncbi:MAG: hypothetical protein EHM20_15200, partial [Alphaproteobacteria bacterium]